MPRKHKLVDTLRAVERDKKTPPRYSTRKPRIVPAGVTLPDVVPQYDRTMMLRTTTEDLERWREAAATMDKTLSDWIRCALEYAIAHDIYDGGTVQRFDHVIVEPRK